MSWKRRYYQLLDSIQRRNQSRSRDGSGDRVEQGRQPRYRAQGRTQARQPRYRAQGRTQRPARTSRIARGRLRARRLTPAGGKATPAQRMLRVPRRPRMPRMPRVGR